MGSKDFESISYKLKSKAIVLATLSPDQIKNRQFQKEASN